MALGGLEQTVKDIAIWGTVGGLVCSTVTAVFKNGIKGTCSSYDTKAIIGGAVAGATMVPAQLIPQGLYHGKIFPEGLLAAKASALAAGAIFSIGKSQYKTLTQNNRDYAPNKEISAFDVGVGFLVGALAMMRYVSSHGADYSLTSVPEIVATSAGIAAVLGFVYHHTWYPLTIAVDPIMKPVRNMIGHMKRKRT